MKDGNRNRHGSTPDLGAPRPLIRSRNFRRYRVAVAGVIVVLLALAVVLAGCSKKEASSDEYYCPMHPTYVSDRPGDCPICNMRLVKREKSAATAPADPGAAGRAHTEHGAQGATQSEPGASGAAPMEHGADSTAMTGGTVPGMAPVTLDARGRELAGIQIAVARRESVAREVRTVGTVVPDESRVRHIHTRIDGYVEKLYVASMGQYVRKGEPVLDVYSPELLASQEEFLRAREAAARFANSSIPEVKQGAADLLLAARRRLELYEVPENFIADLEKRGTALPHVTLEAQYAGYITGKEVREGQHVTPGQELYTVTDLSQVWVEANFYENEASLVRVGQTATLSLPYAGQRARTGRVSYVYPYLEPTTRTLKARLEFANPDLELKPAMFVDVTLEVDAPPAVVIPASAVLDSGVRRVVFVETAPNHFEPRAVEIGLRTAERVEIRSGLQEGERVVLGANFLLDSESRLRGALTGGQGAHQHEGDKR